MPARKGKGLARRTTALALVLLAALAHTRLAHVGDVDGWVDALGSGDVTLTISVSRA